ncbi:LPXTG cell wall anchor domain-containing protein [Streptomyces sp. NPDC051940]|uniref:LPXTG cell wall anchor domain-containing protein n=1 Tax=Streptomyces sp. NPDC051940 TaxID=3155675 RepID=UPI00342AA429
MRTLASIGAVTAAAAASLLFAAPAALATGAPGDNGDIKTHNSTTPQEDNRDEPKVCEFYLDAFNFDGEQKAAWKILSWPPTGDKTEVSNGEITLDAEGNGRTEDMTLEDGHYRVVWNFDGEHGEAKHKMFWVKCEDESPNPSDTPSNPSESPTEGESANPTSSNSPGSQGGGDDLAETGATVGITSAAGLALVGAGAYLVMRRRNASQH